MMLIGGIQKTSLIDYPSRVSCVVFSAGCNFRCPYCHNPGLVTFNPGFSGYDINEFFSFIMSRKPFLEGVVITGGEPTLQPDLFEFCERIQGLGYAIKLDTNGSRPEALEHLIEAGLINYLAMDIKTEPSRYTPHIAECIDTTAILSSIRLILESGISYEFRTTCVKTIVTKADMLAIARLIQGAKLFVLQKGLINDRKILRPDFFKGSDWQYEEQELEQLRKSVSEFVQECIIR
jgi:pyruvate formate lyase activating enzyme